MLDFNDLDEIDYEGQLQAKKNKLLGEIRELSSQIAFPPAVRTAVGMGAIAKHYMGGGILPMIAGAIVGYKIHKQKSLTEIDRNIILQKIINKRNQLEKLDRVDARNTSEIDGIMSSADLMDYDYDKYQFTGKWAKFMGQPSIGFHAMVFGIPKSGKSILCTQMAKYFADNFGSVLYVAAEEGFSMTLQNKIREFGIASENLHYANFREYDQIRTALQNNDFNFVFLDSVNFMKITPEQMRELKQENPQVAFITIQQATKDGKFRGSQEYAHDADIIINVANGVATQQGRFCEPSMMRVFKKGTYQEKQEFADDEEGDEESSENENAPDITGASYGSDFEFNY
jgi:hypothetical protein